MGAGQRAEALTDTALQFELGRTDVNLTSYDFINNKLILKATLNNEFAGTVYEVGLFSKPINSVAGAFASTMVTSFDSVKESWVDTTTGAFETYDTTVARAGIDGLIHTPALSTTKTSSLRNVIYDFSGYTNGDTFNIAYNVGNANTTNIVFRLMTDVNNYYQFTLGAQTAGYKVIGLTKSSAAVTGAPNWGSISEIQVSTTSGAGGASSVVYDGIRVEDVDTLDSDYVLVARKVLATPYVYQPGKSQDVEFSLDISV